MLTDLIKTLSATPPPATTFRSGRHAYARIVQLESQLGLEPSLPIFNTIKANARIAELESLLASKNALAPAPAMPAALAAPVAAATLPANVKSLADYFKLSSADRLQFAQDNGALAEADFDTLRPKAKMDFIRAGGRIISARTETLRSYAPGNPDPGAPFRKTQFAGNGKTTTEAEFEAMTPAAKMDFIRNNGRVI